MKSKVCARGRCIRGDRSDGGAESSWGSDAGSRPRLRANLPVLPVDVANLGGEY
jgi:hypothetical protein